MSKNNLKRLNKTKKEIVSSIQLVEKAERRRTLIKDVIFPYLVEMNDTVGYTKVFLQALSGLINGVFDETRETTTITHILPRITDKLGEIFNLKDPAQKREHERYTELIKILKDISIQDLSYATELPRYIDGYFTSTTDKEKIDKVDINKILGK